MKEYKVRTEHLNFFSNWKNNVRWKISSRLFYSIKCDNQEQLNYCLAILMKVNFTERVHSDGAFPASAYIRWFDSDRIGDIIVTRDPNSAGNNMAFIAVFEEVSELGSGRALGIPDESTSVLSKRLDGHVITI